jgi:translation initiation factor IF-2
MPVEVLGFNGTPEAGDRLAVVDTEARAREIADYRARQKRENGGAADRHARLARADDEQLKTSGRKEFPLVIKGDVQGSIEAIVGALEKLSPTKSPRASSSPAPAASPNPTSRWRKLRAPRSSASTCAPTRKRARPPSAGIEIRYYNIIYDLVDDVKKAMSGLLAPTLRETMLGNATDPRNLQGLQGRQGRRLPRHRRHRRARRQCPADPRQRGRASGQAVAAQALQGRRARSAPARNAAWRSRITRT